MAVSTRSDPDHSHPKKRTNMTEQTVPNVSSKKHEHRLRWDHWDRFSRVSERPLPSVIGAYVAVADGAVVAN